MSFELNRVAQQLFNEAKRERQESGKLTDGLLSALNCVFGQALLHALDLVDRGKLTEYQCLSGRRAFTVGMFSMLDERFHEIGTLSR
jgi:hypothetical protein